MYVDTHSVIVEATPEHTWDVVSHLGGDPRLWTPGPLWRTRGALERLVGGPGHRIEGPGRALAVGDTMDFWRVLEVRPPTRLRVQAESLLPGEAFLDVIVAPQGSRPGTSLHHRLTAQTKLTLRTEFEPAGLVGHAFWWSELGAHKVVFALMARRLAALVTTAHPTP